MPTAEIENDKFDYWNLEDYKIFVLYSEDGDNYAKGSFDLKASSIPEALAKAENGIRSRYVDTCFHNGRLMACVDGIVPLDTLKDYVERMKQSYRIHCRNTATLDSVNDFEL